jgi:hypothetical protein
MKLTGPATSFTVAFTVTPATSFTVALTATASAILVVPSLIK